MHYNIGEFAKMCGVATSTLRFWEKEGLIIPDHINETNGYRQYSAKQIDTVYTLKAYRDMGFAIYDIRDLVDNGIKRERFVRKKSKYERDLIQAQSHLNNLQYMLDDFDRKVIIDKEVPEDYFYTRTYSISSYEDILRTLHMIVNEAEERGIEYDRDYGFRILTDTRYFSNKKFDVRICLRVPKRKNPGQNYMLLPSRKVMATLCSDNTEYIFYAYRNAMVWFSMNGIRVPGNGFELYFFSVDMDRKTVDNSIAFPMEMCFRI